MLEEKFKATKIVDYLKGKDCEKHKKTSYKFKKKILQTQNSTRPFLHSGVGHIRGKLKKSRTAQTRN